MTVDRPHIGLLIGPGTGPTTRAHALLRHLPPETSVLPIGPPPVGMTPAIDPLAFPPQRPSPASEPEPGHPILDADSLGRLARWAGEEAPDLVLVDAPPGVGAVAAAATGVPVVAVREHARDGVAPIAGPHGPAAWIAPYPAELEPAGTAPEVNRRTIHVGFLSRYEGRRLAISAARRRLGIDRTDRHVTVILNGSEPALEPADLAAAAAAATTWSFSVVGSNAGDERWRSQGLRTEPDADAGLTHLVAADVVVASADLGAIADAASVGRSLAIVPGPRPDPGLGQLSHALEEVRAALVCDTWPEPRAWPALLAELLDHDPRPLTRLVDGRAARRAASWLTSWAVNPPVALGDQILDAGVTTPSGAGMPTAVELPEVDIVGP